MALTTAHVHWSDMVPSAAGVSCPHADAGAETTCSGNTPYAALIKPGEAFPDTYICRCIDGQVGVVPGDELGLVPLLRHLTILLSCFEKQVGTT